MIVDSLVLPFRDFLVFSVSRHCSLKIVYHNKIVHIRKRIATLQIGARQGWRSVPIVDLAKSYAELGLGE
jgi:hypothetical protein